MNFNFQNVPIKSRHVQWCGLSIISATAGDPHKQSQEPNASEDSGCVDNLQIAEYTIFTSTLQIFTIELQLVTEEVFSKDNENESSSPHKSFEEVAVYGRVPCWGSFLTSTVSALI